ncbi:nuclear distribution protein pac-1a [Diplogelasinospora grovesii]|uniref:Nuclear distribution protein PAC1 n=1 Tax=Diplogelasinospora grovesii TaxID=303347 RepID=A0AAN6N0G9_9PEZI|nr:nuclear distribution protein pac-1a [Diplogelasinospora grovesii]
MQSYHSPPTMSLLTSRQADELRKSMIAYLAAHNLNATAAALRTELNLGEDKLDAATVKKYEGLLEKKWTSIVRLQKKIMDLESRNAALQFELDNATPSSLSMRNKDPSSWLPRAPPRYTLESHRNAINCLAFHPIFSSVATGSDDFTIKIWDWEVGELERTIKGHTRAILDVDYGGPRGNILLASCSSDLTIKLWDPADDYKNIRTLPGHDHSVSAVRFIPGSANLLVSASRDMTLKIWDVGTGYCVRTLNGHTEWVRDVFPSPDGRFLLSAGDDMTARLWDISVTNTESKLTMFGHEHYIECCALAPPSTYQYLAPMAGLKKPPPASSLADFMATGSRDKTIRLWDARGTCLKTLVGHDNWVRALVFHPGGKYLLSVSDDKTLRCWDLSQDGRCVKVIGDPHDCFISSLRWAPSIVRNVATVEPITDSSAPEGLQDGGSNTNKTTTDGLTTAGTAGLKSQSVQIRCVIATGGVDSKLRIFSS